jgi:nitrogen PTS system EIIA component
LIDPETISGTKESQMNGMLKLTRWLRPRVMHEECSRVGTLSGSASAPTSRRASDTHSPSVGGDAQPCDPERSTQRWKTWLAPQEILLDVDVADRRQALEAAAAVIANTHGLEHAPILRALWRREQVGSTALGQGVAIPHARITGIARPLTLFIRPRYAIAFDAPDGKLVSSILVILVPADGSADDHLQLLASLATAFSDRAFRARLAEASTAFEVTATFAGWAGLNS